MRLLATCLILLGMVGCSGTSPYRDDYARHVNHAGKAPFTPDTFRMAIAEAERLDLRATYDNDNTAGDSSMLYQGGPGAAGLIAMVAQIGVHSSLVSSQREEKLAAIQNAANQHIIPLLDMSSTMSASELIGKEQSPWLATAEDAQALLVKPIFFSSQDMSELSLKLVVWLPDPQGTKKRPNHYKNLIQVFAEPLSDTEREKLKAGDKTAFQQHLSNLLSVGLAMTHQATTGQYSQGAGNMQTYKISKQGKFKVIRAAEVASTCHFTIVRDLHKWLIAIPKEKANSLSPNSEEQANHSSGQQCHNQV